MTAGGPTTLKRELTLRNGIGIIVGSMVGSGIFVSPTGVLKEVRSIGASLVIWVLCGAFSTLGAYCYAELGTCMRESGGDYAYVYRAYGPLLAFLRMWIECMVTRPCTIAIVALTFSQYVIDPLFPTCAKPQDAVRLLAAVCIVILAFVNCTSIKLATWIQDIFTYAKMLALIGIIITGIVQLAYGRNEHLQNAFEGTTHDITRIFLSCYSGLFAYNGWNYLNGVIEEMKNPRRDLPLSIIISCTLVCVVYLCTIISYHTVVSAEGLLASPAVAVTFGNQLYGKAWVVVPIFVALSTFGTVNGCMFTSARLCYVAGRRGHLPEFLNMVSVNRRTPVTSVLLVTLLSCAYLCSTDLYVLINYTGFANFFAIGFTVTIILYFRKTRPDMERPIKLWIGWPCLYVGITVLLLSFAFVASPVESGMSCIIILTGVPVYLICVVWKKPKKFDEYQDKFVTYLQYALLVVPEEIEVEYINGNGTSCGSKLNNQLT